MHNYDYHCLLCLSQQATRLLVHLSTHSLVNQTEEIVYSVCRNKHLVNSFTKNLSTKYKGYVLYQINNNPTWKTTALTIHAKAVV